MVIITIFLEKNNKSFYTNTHNYIPIDTHNYIPIDTHNYRIYSS
jgi:hypothetical protein